MTDVTVYFATNRKKYGSEQLDYGSSSVANDPSASTYAVAEVRGATLNDADAGTIEKFRDQKAGGFSQATQAIANKNSKS